MTKKELDINSFYFKTSTGISGIRSCIEKIEKSSSLYDEKNFEIRVEVIDSLGFYIIDQIEGLLQKINQSNELILLKHRAEKVKRKLEKVNDKLFERLRKKIQNKEHEEKNFKDLVNEYIEFNVNDTEHQEETGYDALDIFINGLTHFHSIPEQTKNLETDMVYYQKTPAKIIFELAEKSHFTKGDVFFDLGSGLGQVVILVNLLAGITVKGVEFEPAFCDYARVCAAELNLTNMEFINTDARNADYSEGTIFFMFTPFKGEILQDVLEILKKESRLRKIKIISYGPCTTQVALQDWLDFSGSDKNNIYMPAIFTSRK